MPTAPPQTSTSPQSSSFLFKYVLSCAASTVAESATYPLDTVKTRLQIQGESAAASHTTAVPSTSTTCDTTTTSTTPRTPKHRGMLRTFTKIVQHEGVLGLYGGLGPAVMRHYVYTGIRMGVYEHLRENILKRRPDGTFPLWKAMLGGMISGAVAQLAASPTDLIKVQAQAEGLRASQGLPPRFHSIWHAVGQVVSRGGVRSLWKGWIPNCQRAALVNMADIATYDQVKHRLLRNTSLRDDWLTHSMSSACAGLAAACTSTPADVVKTRIMNQPTDHRGRGLLYTGSLDCLLKTVRAEGLLALWKGFVPIYARMAPWSLTFWVSFEKIRSLTGASSF